jgi:hypothetical protein
VFSLADRSPKTICHRQAFHSLRMQQIGAVSGIGFLYQMRKSLKNTIWLISLLARTCPNIRGLASRLFTSFHPVSYDIPEPTSTSLLDIVILRAFTSHILCPAAPPAAPRLRSCLPRRLLRHRNSTQATIILHVKAIAVERNQI